MEQVVNMVEKVQRNEPHGKRPTTRKSLSEDWVSAIFTTFRLRYTHQWTSRYPNKKEYELAKREWGYVLFEMKGEQIRRGIEHWDDNHPPNAYEFRNACKEPKNYAAHKPFRALPPPKGDPEKATAGIEALKEIIRR